MSVSEYIVSRPIGVAEISTLLGEGSTDVGTLCLSNNINKWAKCKPVQILQHPQPVTLAEIEAINYSLQNPAGSTNYLTAFNQGFVYNKPRSTDFKRLSDFEGYKHNIEAPMIGIGNILFNRNGSGITLHFLQREAGDEYGIALSELAGYADKYLCLILTVGSTVRMKTAPAKIGNGGTSISLSPSEFSSNYPYTYYVLACNNPHTTFVNNATDTFFPLPFATAAEGSGTLTVYRLASELTVSTGSVIFDQRGQLLSYTVQAALNGTLPADLEITITGLDIDGVTTSHPALETPFTLVIPAGETTILDNIPLSDFGMFPILNMGDLVTLICETDFVGDVETPAYEITMM